MTVLPYFIATGIVEVLFPLGLLWVMAGFVLVTIVLTQPMSNAAAAQVVLPIALATAADVGASPHSFAVLVTLAASLSFMTPLEPACLLVYGPGKYKFQDLVRVGAPLTLITSAVLLLLVPRLWPV